VRVWEPRLEGDASASLNSAVILDDQLPDVIDSCLQFGGRLPSLFVEVRSGGMAHDDQVPLGYAPDDGVGVEQFGGLADRPRAWFKPHIIGDCLQQASL